MSSKIENSNDTESILTPEEHLTLIGILNDFGINPDDCVESDENSSTFVSPPLLNIVQQPTGYPKQSVVVNLENVAADNPLLLMVALYAPMVDGENHKLSEHLLCDRDIQEIDPKPTEFVWSKKALMPLNEPKIHCDPMLKKLIASEDNSSNYRLEMKDFSIKKIKNSDRRMVLKNKLAKINTLLRNEKTLSDEEMEYIDRRVITEYVNQCIDSIQSANGSDPSPNLRYCIGFEAYKCENHRLVKILDNVFTDVILHIYKVLDGSNCISDGGTMMRLSTNALPDEVTVRVFDWNQKTGSSVWSFDILDPIISKDGEISFVMPEYGAGQPNLKMNASLSLTCFITLRSIQNMTSASNKVKCVYRNQPKRPVAEQPNINLDRRRPKYRANTSNFMFRVIKSAAVTNNAPVKTKSNIYHESIKNGDSKVIFDLTKDPTQWALLRDAKTDQDETLLHYACKHNKHEYLRPLFEIGCRLSMEDVTGSTPLHIAIRQSRDCIDFFRAILQSPGDNPQALEDLIYLFDIYDREGFTALHWAVIQDCRELVVDLLEFSKQQKIDVCEITDITDGNTILHLAIIKDLREMSNIIMEHIPEIRDYANYAGNTPEIEPEH